MISSIFGTRFNHKKHVKSSSCSRPPISTTRIRLRVCTKLHSKTLPLGKKRKKTLWQHSHAARKGCFMNKHPFCKKDKKESCLEGCHCKTLPWDWQTIWSYILVSVSWNLLAPNKPLFVGRALISHPASFSEVADVLPRTPRWLGVGSKMKNTSARPYNPVHCTWQGQRNKFSWLSLFQRCERCAPANSIWVWAMKLSSSKWWDPLAQSGVKSLCIFGPIHSWVLLVVVVITWSAQTSEGHGCMDHIWDPQYQAVPSVPRTMLRWAVLPARCLELMLYAPRKQSYNSFKDFYEAGLSWLGLKRSRKVGSFVVWSGRWYLGQAAAVLSPVPGLSNLSSPCCHSCYGFDPASPYECLKMIQTGEYPQMVHVQEEIMISRGIVGCQILRHPK
jgi:hypothetical protein